MIEVTDSERIFKKVKQLAKYAIDCEGQIKKIERDARDQIEALEDLKEVYIKRMDNLKNYYHEITKPGFKIHKWGFNSPKNMINKDYNPQKHDKL